MPSFAFVRPDGLINNIASAMPDSYAVGKTYNGNLCVAIDDTVDKFAFITGMVFSFTNSTFRSLPIKPSSYHIWDSTTETWVEPANYLSILQQEKITLVENERTLRAIAAISYDTKLLDADLQAQSNINGKLQEIFAREAINTPLLPAEMFWKDANNNIHAFADQNTYKLWLQGLVIAISSRNTALYATAWTKKAEILAFTDTSLLTAYDTTINW